MQASSVAGIITAVATALIALGGVITAITVLIPILRGTRDNARTIEAVHTSVGEVHTIVNQQRTDALRYQERLTEALVAAGIPVPTDSSLRAPDGGPAA